MRAKKLTPAIRTFGLVGQLGLVGLFGLTSCTTTPEQSTIPGPAGQDGQDGQNGNDGFSSLVRVLDEPAGANCATGGSVIQSGADVDRDGVLSDTEVTSASYVCRDGNGDLPDVFTIRIENLSDTAALPSILSPAVWATFASAEPLFTAGQPDRGLGLESLAEDGNPTVLAASLDGNPEVGGSGIVNVPVGTGGTGPLFPGQAYELVVTTTARTPKLAIASMFGQSNDVIVATRPGGIDLYDVAGQPVGSQLASSAFAYYDVGTEANEAPGIGRNQAPRQSATNTGPGEVGVRALSQSTRSLPLAKSLVDISVSKTGETFTITLENVSAANGAFVSPIAPMFWAVHDDSWSLFTDRSPASPGLEKLAEDGSPAMAAAEHANAPGIASLGTQAATIELPSQPGPLLPGTRYQISVTPDAGHRYLTIAGMVGQSNDSFIAFAPSGLALMAADGSPRSAADVERDANELLAIWDAGTEANEAPGVGPNQAPRQAAANTGAPDPDGNVRRYNDTINDFAGAFLGAAIDVTITREGGPRTFRVQVTNTSGGSAYPVVLGPPAWATHDATFALFEVGAAASAGLEKLAEDGSPAILADELSQNPALFSSGAATARNNGGNGPLVPGDGYSFTVTMDAGAPRISMAAMVVPSNDTFWGFGPNGIALLDEAGNARSDADIAADIRDELIAWDAGTEANQAAAGGRDMAPNQSGPNTGLAEGSGTVRELDDEVWAYPALDRVLRVQIDPVVRR